MVNLSLEISMTIVLGICFASLCGAAALLVFSIAVFAMTAGTSFQIKLQNATPCLQQTSAPLLQDSSGLPSKSPMVV
jgi:hypothetical protein